ncbi:hypothetical protein CWO04_09560 [Vibrio splendidus]|uniref:hypothetical protein n=1 Tax=Vibrio splendidus TaxID=29497 RepID=UPI000D356152|nr:hypothetical protein [Vibrio splendidus]PTP87158.1 hypothetical protein CWO04_09560 [Vibrio splendidus]
MSDKTKSFLAGGVGGILPTAVTLATMLTKDPTSRVIDDITFGFYAGLLLFFIIGGAVSICTVADVQKLKDAVIAGIAAPALITSVGAGIEKHPSKASLFDFELITTAYASENYETPRVETLYEYNIKSIPNGSNDWRQNSLNYDVILENSFGEQQKLVISGSNDELVKFKSNTPLQKVWVADTDGVTLSEFEVNTKSSGELLLQPYVEAKKDFFWVLGAKGKAEVVGVDAQFVPQEIKVIETVPE